MSSSVILFNLYTTIERSTNDVESKTTNVQNYYWGGGGQRSYLMQPRWCGARIRPDRVRVAINSTLSNRIPDRRKESFTTRHSCSPKQFLAWASKTLPLCGQVCGRRVRGVFIFFGVQEVSSNHIWTGTTLFKWWPLSGRIIAIDRRVGLMESLC